MPIVKTPLRPYTDFPALKRRKKLLMERVNLYVAQKGIEARLREVNDELFPELRSALPEDVKSVDFEGYQVTTLWNDPQRYFDRNKAVETEFKCPCSKCKGREKITVPAKVIDTFYKLGKQSKPTVSVKKIKTDDSEAES